MNNDLWIRAQKSVAQGALTNSKHPRMLIMGAYPTHISHGSGSYLFDHEGNKYTDYICGLGANFLGYGNDLISRELIKQIYGGFSHSLPTHHEVECAEKLKEFFVFTERWKFLKTGSEACSAAIKIARNYWGVSDGNENMHEMWAKEIARRLSHEVKEEEYKERKMQNLHQRISDDTKNNGDQEKSSNEICKNIKRNTDREKTQSEAMGKSENIRKGQGLFSGEKSFTAWDYNKESMREMWRQEISSPSPGLRRAIGRDVAMSIASRTRARWLILSDGYHGHHDSFVSVTSPHNGVPMHLGILPLNGNEDLIEIAAAVIIEPVITDYSSERIEYLKELRKKCTDTGTMLIFDEVITGFRFSKFGVCNYTGIIPDLIVIGKAMANGLPLAAVGGKAEVMDDPRYFVSSTYAGEILSLVACKSVLDQLQKNSEYSVDKLWVHGQEFIDQFNAQPGDIKIEGYPTRGVFTGDQENQAIFMGAMAKAYVLFCKSFFYNFGHPAQDKDILSLTIEIKERIVNKVLKLEYPLPESPFSMKVRQNG